MLNTNNKIYKFILILSIVCILLALYFNFYLLTSNKQSLIFVILGFFNSTSLIYAAFYIFYGYKKNASLYYRNYGVLLAISQTISLAIISVYNPTVKNLIVVGSELLTILGLILNEDLGRNKSFILCLLLIVLNGASFFISDKTYFSYCNIYCKFTLTLLYSTLTYAKYVDKEYRKTK